MFEANFVIRSAVVQSQKVQRARQEELGRVECAFDRLVQAIERRRARLVQSIEAIYSKLDTEILERIKAARDQVTRCGRLVNSLAGFSAKHEKELALKFSFSQGTRNNILELNKAAGEMITEVEKEFAAVQKAISGSSKPDYVLPECTFNSTKKNRNASSAGAERAGVAGGDTD